MSNRSRDILTVATIVALALISFGAGYLINELVKNRSGGLSFTSNGDDFSLFWEAWGRIEESYIGELPGAKQTTYGAVRGAIDVLKDPYTIFVEPAARDQERENLRGNFGGIGATLQRDEDGRLILAPIAGNPAGRAGIVEGDVLLAVDGRPITSEMTVGEIAQLVRGEEGTEVVLTVLHVDDDEPVAITIVREVILLPSVTANILAEEPTIGYIRLSRFSGESGGEMREAILNLQEQGAEKLILDLRQNGGGLLEAAVEVSDLFLSGGPVLYQVSKSEDEKVFAATEGVVAGDLPLVVLIDGSTASSAEIVAGALRDRGRAKLIGVTSFGKGSVQLVYDLSDGSSVHVTSARWFTPSRHQIDQQGLEPDIVVEPSQEAIQDGRDETLERAVDLLRET